MKNKLCIYILFLLLGCMACSFSTTQEKYKTLISETWERDSNYKLEFDITQPGNYACLHLHPSLYRLQTKKYQLLLDHPTSRSRS